MAEAASPATASGPAVGREPDSGPGWERSFDILRFGRRFVPLALISYAVASVLPEALIEPACHLTARTAAELLGLFGTKVVVTGTAITSGAFMADVIPECTPLFMVGLFCSFVLAAPVPVRSKALGIACGIPLLTILNLVRIALVVATGRYFPAIFYYVHVYLGQVAMIFAVFIICLVWFRSVTATPSGDGNLSFPLRFAVFSALLFFPWLYLNRWYVLAGDSLVRVLFALFGYQLSISYNQELYYHTFNLIGFAALMLASRSLSPSGKVKGIVTGFLILCLTHILIRVCNVLVTGFQMASADKLSLVLSVTGDYLVPVILWMATAFHREKADVSSSNTHAQPAGTRAPRPSRHL
jgi:exosortase H (IPTLxxWG-CTERM-specific)